MYEEVILIFVLGIFLVVVKGSRGIFWKVLVCDCFCKIIRFLRKI